MVLQEVVFTSHVLPACLPTDPGRSYAGATAHVSGWGTTQVRGEGVAVVITAHAQESGDTSSVLKETQQTILANTDPVCVTGGRERCCSSVTAWPPVQGRGPARCPAASCAPTPGAPTAARGTAAAPWWSGRRGGGHWWGWSGEGRGRCR